MKTYKRVNVTLTLSVLYKYNLNTKKHTYRKGLYIGIGDTKADAMTDLENKINY